MKKQNFATSSKSKKKNLLIPTIAFCMVITIAREHHSMMTKQKSRQSTPPKTIGVKKNEVRGFFVVMNDKGLHTRPSTELVKCATSFKAQVNLIYQNIVVNAKSLLGILTLAAAKGSKIEIEAFGEDAEEAVRHIIELAKNKFYIHY